MKHKEIMKLQVKDRIIDELEREINPDTEDDVPFIVASIFPEEEKIVLRRSHPGSYTIQPVTFKDLECDRYTYIGYVPPIRKFNDIREELETMKRTIKVVEKKVEMLEK